MKKSLFLYAGGKPAVQGESEYADAATGLALVRKALRKVSQSDSQSLVECV